MSSLADWPHRVYSNLLAKVDDAGRQDGRLNVLQSILFPLGLDTRRKDLTYAIKALEESRLAIPYEYAGKPYLQLTKWQRCGNAVTSKFPWRDGSFEIVYVTLPTRDGNKDFVSSSLLDHSPPKAANSGPHADGVASDLNTKTKTNYEYGDVLRRRIRSAHEQQELESKCFEVLGKDEMARYGSRWRKRIEEIPDQLEAVLNEVASMMKEKRIRKSTARTAEDLIKRGFGR